ncbi:MAG: nitrile hydratase subunit beta [Beijerinckiaceae bacterium]|nr:nitrile hydratase subunit beta [Beijerinckiaceae bacterium]
MITIEDFMHRLPNDVGGQASPAFARVEHALAPWEKRCHALADVLDYHKLISTEEKRRGVEGLGADVINRLSYYERWATAFAVLLFEKGILTPTELAEKMAEIEARWPDERVSSTGEPRP